MGWVNENAPRHEGYLLAVRAGTNELGSVTFRQLDDDDAKDGPVQVRIVQIGCDCGWRSQRLRAPQGTTWDGIVLIPCGAQEAESTFEARCRELWREHAFGATVTGREVVDD